jgi:hypothetical protein
MDCYGHAAKPIWSIRSVDSKGRDIYITGGDEPSFGEYCNKAILYRKKVYKRRETS